MTETKSEEWVGDLKVVATSEANFKEHQIKITRCKRLWRSFCTTKLSAIIRPQKILVLQIIMEYSLNINEPLKGQKTKIEGLQSHSQQKLRKHNVQITGSGTGKNTKTSFSEEKEDIVYKQRQPTSQLEKSENVSLQTSKRKFSAYLASVPDAPMAVG